MDKHALIEQIRAALEAELATVAASAATAKREATHEEAKPENEYDTRGLEASYLAGAQEGRARDLAHRINNLEFVVLKDFGPADPIGLSAVVTLDDGERTRTYFIAPDGGGMKLTSPDGQIVAITTQSPVGRALVERKQGDIVEVRLRGALTEFEVVEVC